MSFKKLQLNLLSQSGELIHCVSCFAGQVSVFRSPSFAALESYQRALAGIPGPERISISLDGQNFIPSEHCYIGFGEQRENGAEQVIRAFENLGLSEEQAMGLCRSFGVEVARRTTWHSLSRCEDRRVRLILATQSRNQVIILSDPLEPLGNQWRDRFAELLVQFASTHKALIVVTNLSTRPASWIDNAAVARIQVGDEIQRTIGFGSEQSKAQAIVQQLRDAATVAPSSQKNSPATENKKPQSTGFSLTESREEPAPAPFFETVALSCIFGFLDRLGFEYNDQRVYERFLSVQQLITSPMIGGLIAGSIILMGGSYLISSKDAHSPDHVARLNVPVEPIPSAPEQDVASGSTAETQPSNSAPIPSEQPAEPAPPIRMSILDEYPPSIKASIQASFQGLSTALDTPASSTGPRTKSSNPKEETGELLKLLETTSDSGEGVPDSPPPSEQYYDNQQQIAPSTQNSASNPGSEEEKREAIRKRFLEAIERAQSMRRQGGSE